MKNFSAGKGERRNKKTAIYNNIYLKCVKGGEGLEDFVSIMFSYREKFRISSSTKNSS